MLKKYVCGRFGLCEHQEGSYCKLIPGACKDQRGQQPGLREIQECCLCSHRNVCKYREDFERKKGNTYIKLECKYFRGV